MEENFISTHRVIKAIEKQKPDIVHVHCINCYCINIYRLLYYLGSNGIKTVITHHAEFLYTGNCPHAYSCNKWQKSNGCFDCNNLEEATGTRIIDRTHISWLKMKKAFDSFQNLTLRDPSMSDFFLQLLLRLIRKLHHQYHLHMQQVLL